MGGNTTLAAFADRWLNEYVEKQLEPTTAASYRHERAKKTGPLTHFQSGISCNISIPIFRKRYALVTYANDIIRLVQLNIFSQRLRCEVSKV